MLFLGIFSSFAQLSSGKLFILHEGSSAQKGTIGYVDYATNTYTHIDSIARYGNQIEVHNQLLGTHTSRAIPWRSSARGLPGKRLAV